MKKHKTWVPIWVLKCLLQKSWFYSSRRPKPWHYLFNFRLFFLFVFRYWCENCKTQKNLIRIYLRFTHQSKNQSVPNWVLKTQSTKKWFYSSRQPLFQISNLRSILLYFCLSLAVFVHQSGKRTKKTYIYLQLNNWKFSKSGLYMKHIHWRFECGILTVYKSFK